MKLPGVQSARGVLTGNVIVGLLILGIFVFLAIFGSWISPYDPSATSNATLSPPSWSHLLGTTQTGQDVLSQVLVGSRASLVVAFLAAAVATFLSLVIGTAAGFMGGIPDEGLSAISNVFLVIPTLPLAIVLAGYLPNGGELPLALVISITGWAWGARVIRAQALSLRRRDYIVAARASGEPVWRLVLADMFPALLPVIAIQFLTTVIFAILTEAGLAFLGLGGIDTWSWGSMLYWASEDTAWNQGAWWWFVPPGLCIALVGTSLALINFGLDEVLNPKLRSARAARRARAVSGHTNGATSSSSLWAGASAQILPGSGTGRAAGSGSAPIGSALVQTSKSSRSKGRDVVLEVRHLSVRYGEGPDAVHAVTDLNFTLHNGEVLGIAGESGCGKSTLVHALCRILRPPAVVESGELVYHPRGGGVKDLLSMSREELSRFRWQELAVVFQSAMNALNPVITVRAQIVDAIQAHRPQWSKDRCHDRATELLDLVHISSDRLNSYPHELSGGMRQRVCIAMAMALEPDIVVMDEPTTALDVVVQREILDELVEIRGRLGFSVIFVTHDLSLLIELADRIAIMYAGRIVELSPAREIYQRPAHPYTAGLGGCFPSLHGPLEVVGMPGSPPDLRTLEPGCTFLPRCPYGMPACATVAPRLIPGRTPGYDGSMVACLLHDAAYSASVPASLRREAVSRG
jgi:oligopeptide/dipeptide ABC transporter ATP-binding protein